MCIYAGSSTESQWSTYSDWMDRDGDGISEYYKTSIYPQQNSFQGGSSGLKYDPAGKPPRLLHTIHNGRGGDTVINYTHMHDSTVVTENAAQGKVTPKS
jgi:hypothetical protein